ncbi:hypothetical protein [Microbispora sp. H13382]|uniref:hypothetical protein n=1 Tax=Microbispora sp. H13382 TaxID=2729112 RepID=UPI001C7253CA|nr:hypothetical protein [Microbispora sp. H13382]
MTGHSRAADPAACRLQHERAEGATEQADTILLATGYRPDLPYLAGLGALDAAGRPLHRDGASLTHPLLAYVGLEWQRSLSSDSLRGVGRDATRTARRRRQTRET